MALDLEDLYRDILLDHYRNPRNHGDLDGRATAQADGANPLCGDEVSLHVRMADGRIVEVAFSGQGCSISQASSSMMTEYVLGQTAAEALRGVEAFGEMMTRSEVPADVSFDDIEALMGVAKFPARVKCASLGWKTLEQALNSNGAAEVVSTDERATESAPDERGTNDVRSS